MGLKSGSKSGKGSKQGTSKVTTSKTQPQVPSKVVDSDDEPEMDNSVLRPSIEISVSGVPQLVQAYQAATEELRSVLAAECDIIYECRVCRNLFRSVANMMAHKRVYCQTKYSFSRNTLNRKHVEDYTMVIQPEPVPSSSQETQNWSTSDKVPDDATHNDLTSIQVVSSTSKISSYKCPRKDLKDIVDKLKRNTYGNNSKVTNGVPAAKLRDTANTSVFGQKSGHQEHSYQLEDIDTSKVGKFQTKLASPTSGSEKEDLMKAQVSELQNMSSQNEAILGPDGRTIVANGIPLLTDGIEVEKVLEINAQKSSNDEHVCPDCNVKFSTRKTLNHHMKSLHVMFRLCYPCPCCKSTFVNPWSVYRHLYKVHRKTNAQVRRLRPQIQRKAFRKEISTETSATETSSKNEVLKESQRLDLENQEWMDNFEDDLELQRCGGCGRRFERRAALNSHSQICQKRIAARNNVKVIQKVTSNSSSEKAGKVDIEVLEVEANKKTGNMNKSTDSLNDSPGTSRARLSNSNSWTDQPKKEVPEKKIEIQIRKDYCKMSSASSVQALSTDTQSEPDSRPPSRIAEGDNLDDVQDWESMESVNEVDDDAKEEIETVCTSLKDQHCANDNGSLHKFTSHFAEGMDSTRKRRASSDEKDTSLSGSSDDKEGETIQRKKQQKVNEENTGNCFNRSSSSKIRRVEEFHPIMAARMQKFINLRRLQCLPCQKKFNKLTNLRRHVAVHIGWCRYRCTLCSFKCFSKYDCVDHVCKVHLKGVQRTKAATLVEYIEEQEVETENTKSNIAQAKPHPSDSPSHDDDDMPELMDSTIHCLNLEDIRNIVGVTSYPETGKDCEENEKPPEPSTEYKEESEMINDKNTSGSANSSDDISEVKILDESQEFQVNIAREMEQERKDGIEKVNEELRDSEYVNCDQEKKQEIIDESVDAVERKDSVEPSNISDVPFEKNSEKVLDNKTQDEHEENTVKRQELVAEPLSEPTSEEKLNDSVEGTLETQEEKIEVTVNREIEDNSLMKSESPTDSSLTPIQEEERLSSDPIVETCSNPGSESDHKSESFCLPESVIEDVVTSASSDQKLDECNLVSNSGFLETVMTIKQERDDFEAEEEDVSEDLTSTGCVGTVESASEVNDKENALRKMVMEVIFGSGDTSATNSDANQNLFSVSLNGNAFEDESSEKSERSSRASPTSDVDIVVINSTNNHIPSVSAKSSKSRINIEHGSAVENERRERPVRNRVKVEKEDFIYDYSESFLKKEEASKTVNKKKHIDSTKDSLKPEGTRNVTACKCVPKLMLVRTDGTNITGAAKGTWSSVYTQQLSSPSNKSSIATNPQIYSTVRKPPHVFEQ